MLLILSDNDAHKASRDYDYGLDQMSHGDIHAYN